jgi:hypothetical protein
MCKHFFGALNDRASTIKFNDAAEKFRLVELVFVVSSERASEREAKKAA